MHKLKSSALAVGIGLLSLVSTSTQAADATAIYAPCVGCHGPNGKSVVPLFPKLAGQNQEYLVNQLKDFKSGARAGGQAAMMLPNVINMSEEDMVAVAKWLSEQQ